MYRLTEGVRASADIAEGVKATAVYGGSKEMTLSSALTPMCWIFASFDVTTYMDESEVDKQTVKKLKN